MDKPTVQDIFHRFYPAYLDQYSPSPVQGKVNIDQGMPDKNDEKYPVLWAYPLAVPSFLSKGLRMPIMDLLLT